MQHRITIFRHGAKSGTAPGHVPPDRPERGIIGGWSSKAARRNAEFLQSVDYDQLTGLGLAFTGTVRDCPSTPDDWKRTRSNFFKRLRRLGLIRAHDVTEWQRRGVPHLHGMLFFPECSGSEYIALHRAVRDAWLAVTAGYGTSARGVHIAPMTDAAGWAEYTAKHAARGVNHYQRSKDNIPASWTNGTGKMWAVLGEWPVCEPMGFQADFKAFTAYRRLCRSWRKSTARASGNPRHIRFARRCLKSNDRKQSSVRGVNDWVPESLSMGLLFAAAHVSGGQVFQHR